MWIVFCVYKIINIEIQNMKSVNAIEAKNSTNFYRHGKVDKS